MKTNSEQQSAQEVIHEIFEEMRRDGRNIQEVKEGGITKYLILPDAPRLDLTDSWRTANHVQKRAWSPSESEER